MTKEEANRLGIVETKLGVLETKIDGLVERINIQEKTISAAMAAQEKNIGTAMIASEKAIVKAEIANDLRFGEIDKKIAESVKNIETNIATLTESKNIISGAKTGVTDSKVDLTRYLGWIVSILSIAAVFVALFFGK